MPFCRAPWTGLAPPLTRFLVQDERCTSCERALSPAPSPSPLSSSQSSAPSSPSPCSPVVPTPLSVAALDPFAPPPYDLDARHNPLVQCALAPPSAHLRRGRKRKLPIMSNSERAKYYRTKNAEAKTQLDQAIASLKLEVDELQMKTSMQRQLVARTSPVARTRILETIWRFVTTQLTSGTRGVHDGRAELVSVDVRGGQDAPIVLVRARVVGKLATRVVHDIYPFVLGNTVVLDELMHRDILYPCSYVFHFAPDGALQRYDVSVDTIRALQALLPSLATVARVLEAVDVHEPAAYKCE